MRRYTPHMDKIKIERHSATGTLWVLGWLFTIGFLHLGLWKTILAIILWPYYLGNVLSLRLH